MKKPFKLFLLILMSIVFVTVFGTTIVSSLLIRTNPSWYGYQGYDYQSGPQKRKKIISASKNPYLDYFYGDSAYNYVTYHADDNGQFSFFGDEKNVKRTPTINQELKLWKHDFSSKQLILFKNKNENITDLKISVHSVGNNTWTAPDLKVNFLLPIKATNASREPTAIYRGRYLAFDEISLNPRLEKMEYDFQPLLISLTSGDLYGKFEYEIKLTFMVHNQEQTIKMKQVVNIVNQDLNQARQNLKGTDSFNFDTMITPTQSQKFIFADDSTFQTQSLPGLNVNNKHLFWEIWDYTKYANNQIFLKEDKQEYFIKFYQDLLKKSGMTYGYTSDFGINYIKFGLNNQRTDVDDRTDLTFFDDYRYEDFFKRDDLEWIFNFDSLDQYVEMLIKAGFSKVYIPVTVRNTFSFPFIYSSQNYDVNKPQPNPRLSLRERFIDSKGELTPEANTFYQLFFPKFVKNLSQHINETYQNGKWKINNGKDLFQFYFSFDETSFEIDQKIMNLTKENEEEPVIKFHSYTGWEFKVDLKNRQDIMKKLVNEFDDLTLQQREYLYLNEDILKYIVNERKKKNKITQMYSSWNNYPASFLGSTPGEGFWGEILAAKFQLNGYNRHSLDYFSNNITKDQEEINSRFEPGDTYLIYPGENNTPWYSLRLINLIEGVLSVIKEKSLNPFPYDRAIHLSLNHNPNLEYKWNLAAFKNLDDVKRMLVSRKNFSASEQVALFKNWIYFAKQKS